MIQHPAKAAHAMLLLQVLIVELLHGQQVGAEQLRVFGRDHHAIGGQLQDLLRGCDHGLLHNDGTPKPAFFVGDLQSLLSLVNIDQTPRGHDRVDADRDLIPIPVQDPDAVIVADVLPAEQLHRLALKGRRVVQLHAALLLAGFQVAVPELHEGSDTDSTGGSLHLLHLLLQQELVILELLKPLIRSR